MSNSNADLLLAHTGSRCSVARGGGEGLLATLEVTAYCRRRHGARELWWLWRREDWNHLLHDGTPIVLCSAHTNLSFNLGTRTISIPLQLDCFAKGHYRANGNQPGKVATNYRIAEYITCNYFDAGNGCREKGERHSFMGRRQNK